MIEWSDEFVVAYETSDPKHPLAHYQVWKGGRLIDWCKGVPPQSHVKLRRSRKLDRLDHRRQVASHQLVRGTLLVILGQELDLLGSSGRIYKDLDGWKYDYNLSVRLLIEDSPFGTVQPTLRWNRGVLTVVLDDRRPVALEVVMSFSDALSWLWSDFLLGHLMYRGVSIDLSDVFLLSAVEGVVKLPCADTGQPAPTTLDTLLRFQAIRQPVDLDVPRFVLV